LDAVVHLIRWHDYRFTLTPAGMRKASSKIGKNYMDLLFEVNRADTSAKNPALTKEKFDSLKEATRLYQEIIERDECVSLKELNINGNDLIEVGLKPGKQLGIILNRLLDAVIDKPELNQKELLLELARNIIATNP